MFVVSDNKPSSSTSPPHHHLKTLPASQSLFFASSAASAQHQQAAITISGALQQHIQQQRVSAMDTSASASSYVGFAKYAQAAAAAAAAASASPSSASIASGVPVQMSMTSGNGYKFANNHHQPSNSQLQQQQQHHIQQQQQNNNSVNHPNRNHMVTSASSLSSGSLSSSSSTSSATTATTSAAIAAAIEYESKSERQYNKRNKHFANYSLRKEAWTDISSLLNLSPDMASNAARERLHHHQAMQQDAVTAASTPSPASVSSVASSSSALPPSSAAAAAAAAAANHPHPHHALHSHQQTHLHHIRHPLQHQGSSRDIAAAASISNNNSNSHTAGGIVGSGSSGSIHTSSSAGSITQAHHDIDPQILELKKQQEEQKQMLWKSFQERNKELELQHQLELEHRIKELHEQRRVAEAEHQHQQAQAQAQQHQQQQQQQLQQLQQHQRRDAVLSSQPPVGPSPAGGSAAAVAAAAAASRRKDMPSANASSEVKQKLQNFLMNKKQNAAANGMTSTTSPYRNWGVVKSSSGESLPAGSGNSAHPYKIPQQPPSVIAKYDSDFPLRKTDCGVSNDSGGPASPPSATLAGSLTGSRGSPTSAPIQEENEDGDGRGCINDLTLFTSPSMPNISLGRSHMAPNLHSAYALLSMIRSNSQTMVPAAGSQPPPQPPFYMPALPSADGSPQHMDQQPAPPLPAHSHNTSAPLSTSSSASNASNASLSAASSSQQHSPPHPAPQQQPQLAYPTPLRVSDLQHHHHQQQQQLEMQHEAHMQAAAAAAAAAAAGHPPIYGNPITDSQAAHARLNKQGHRPLGRTQSAPLPLGHPHLTGLNIDHTHYENNEAELQAYEHQHALLTAKIRQTVLSRAAMNRAESQLPDTVEETADAVREHHMQQTYQPLQLHPPPAAASAALDPGGGGGADADDVVIDLTGKKQPPKAHQDAVPTASGASSVRDQEYLQQQRELLINRHAFMHQQQQYLQQHLSPPPTHGAHHPPPALHHPYPSLHSMHAAHHHPMLQLPPPPAGTHDDPFGALLRPSTMPLARTLSSPLVPLATGGHPDHNIPSGAADLSLPHRRNQPQLPMHPPQLVLEHSPVDAHGGHRLTTGLAYDSLMLKHACQCGNNTAHPEHPGRLQSVWARLFETGLAVRCDRLRSRKATLEELQCVHTEPHMHTYAGLATAAAPGKASQAKTDADDGADTAAADPNDERPALTADGLPTVALRANTFVRLACGGIGADSDTTWHEQHTGAAARMAAGCVIDLAMKTARGDVRNGFAVVRPPGHHAEPDLAMGFCFFNSVAIAARLLRQRMPERVRRVLIVDWDIHHGNGTQQVFYADASVLYVSVHRHDDGHFFPGTGGAAECGAGAGLGYNVNVAWSGGLDPPLGDAEYLAAWRTVVMPIAREYDPDVVLVSAGFDAAAGHSANLGGYVVSPACFGYLTRELMQLAGGRVVLALEGGYDLAAICDSAQECVRALLGDPLSGMREEELERMPSANAVQTLQRTIAVQASHWPCVKRYADTVSMSAVQAARLEREESETVTAMAGLSMQNPNRNSAISTRSDSEEPMDQDELK